MTPTLIQPTAVRYIRPGARACDITLPEGTRLARLDSGTSLEYVVADPELLHRLAGGVYHPSQPYCFVPEECASEKARPEAGRVVSVEPSLMEAWNSASVGFFDPMSYCVDSFGALPGTSRTGAGCRAAFGSPIPMQRRKWEHTDYALSTDVDGLVLEVRPRFSEMQGNRFGYALTMPLARAINREVAEYSAASGQRLETWDMPDGSLSRRASDALCRAVDAVGAACGMERVMSTAISPR